jgi:hypothetical protein
MITKSFKVLGPKDCETQREAEEGLEEGNVKERLKWQIDPERMWHKTI